MSKTVSIRRTVAVETNIEAEVDVTVYSVNCAVHRDLDFAVKADGDGDLTITVEPCEHCITDAKEEGRSEAQT